MHATVAEQIESRASITPMHADARVSSPQVSQMVRGHQATVLEHAGEWRRVQTADGYTGWCHVGYVRSIPSTHSLPSGWQDERWLSLGCVVVQANGQKTGVPLGGLLEPDETVLDGLAMNRAERQAYIEANGPSIVTRSVELFSGTSYQWGGITPWGADCSGFVQSMYALSGIALPRDAWQQAEIGERLGGDWKTSRAGDLLFFAEQSTEKTLVSHVAIAMGDHRVVHCSLSNGGFGIDDLDAQTAVAAKLRAMFSHATRVLKG